MMQHFFSKNMRDILNDMILYDYIFVPYQDLHIRTNLTLRPSLFRLLMTEIPPCLLVRGTQSP